MEEGWEGEDKEKEGRGDDEKKEGEEKKRKRKNNEGCSKQSFDISTISKSILNLVKFTTTFGS